MAAEVVTVTEQLENSYDVVVVGGGAAGLNGALMLGRVRRSVVVIDAGAPRNARRGRARAAGPRRDAPAELLERGRQEVRRYGGHVVRGEVGAVARDDDGDGGGGFTVTLTDGRTVSARRLLVTTGLVDELPDVPGLRDRWGRDVMHCPYCHGWEARDRAIGVLAGGPMSVHQALLFRQLSADVTFFSHTAAPPAGEAAEQLAARGIRVVEGEVTALEIAGDRLTGVRLSDGTVVGRQVLVVSSRMVARTGFLEDRAAAAQHPSGAGEHIPSDATGRTDVPGCGWRATSPTCPPRSAPPPPRAPSQGPTSTPT
nr:NAD(P)/FAD-dependent oxidoreductase [Planobispora longispora]